MINSLPEEITQDILLRLPIKSLIRCTSVSKPWLSIIRNLSFIRSHLTRKVKASDRHETQLLLHGCSNVFRDDGWHEEEVYCLHYDNHDFDECCRVGFQLNRIEKPVNKRFRVAGVCDGLVCLADDTLQKMWNYKIWNPSIRKAVMLPWPSVTFSHGPYEDSIGFGFDAITNDYKVVRLVTVEALQVKGGSNPTVAEVYSLATGSWKSLGSVAVPCQVLGVRPHCYFNGAIHWVVKHWGTADHYFILAFDMGTELFREIMVPKGTEMDSGSRLSVSEDGKSLALFTAYRSSPFFCRDICSLDIWVMKEYFRQESWTKLITLGPLGLDRSLIPKPLCFRKSGEVFLVLTDRYRSRRHTLVSLDLVSQKWKALRVFDFDDPFGCQEFCSLDYCEESLVLLDMDNTVSC